SPPHTVDDFLSLNEQGELDLSEERFTKVLLDKIAELKSRSSRSSRRQGPQAAGNRYRTNLARRYYMGEGSAQRCAFFISR
ncbi:MAG TPA: hypothetical protein VGQ96_04515, partial [Candidatus Eremiobacteraceae bacterium]|nr:hypothetical protein [Candidatus Eremiobacteraceae bacterium]